MTIEFFYAVAPSWHALPPFYPLFASDFVFKFGTRARSSAIRNYPQFAKAAQYQLFAKHLIRSARSAKLNCNYFSALQLCLFWGFFCPHPADKQRPGCRSALRKDVFSSPPSGESEGKQTEIRFKVTKAILITTCMCGTRWLKHSKIDR